MMKGESDMRECACTQKEAIRRLKKWGYLDKLEVTKAVFKRALRRFQKFNGLKSDGIFGSRSARQFMHPHRCGLPDIMPIVRDGLCLWPHKDVRYYQQAMFLQGVSYQRAASLYKLALQSWSNVCDIQFLEQTTFIRANIWTSTGRGRLDNFDGRGGTLAWAEMPCSGVVEATRLRQKYDADEIWTERMLFIAFLHELGHSIGIQHLEAGNVMAPFLNIDLSGLQPGDIAEAVKRYGEPVGGPGGPGPQLPLQATLDVSGFKPHTFELEPV